MMGMQEILHSLLPFAKSKDGFSAFLIVLVIASIGVSVLTASSLLGIGFLHSSSIHGDAFKARYIADACAEEVLERTRRDGSFMSTGNIFIDAGECLYEIVDLGGGDRRIQVTATVKDVLRRLEITVSVAGPRVETADWREVTDF